MVIMKLTTSILIALCAIACTRKEVGFDTLEQARLQARENAEYNAQEFRAKNPEYAGFAIASASDSTQTKTCPTGDAWATLSLKNVSTSTFVKLKCSTVSNAVGCILESEFKTKAYANEDGHCNIKLPFPLPKLAK
jgi:hypothetical protein